MNFVVVDNCESDLVLFAQKIIEVIPKCNVQVFTDPLLAAKYICNNTVDMVFLADTMQPVNGFRLLQVLRKNVLNLTIIMLSDGEMNKMDAIHVGADEYLIKPVTAEKLEYVIEMLCESNQNY